MGTIAYRIIDGDPDFTVELSLNSNYEPIFETQIKKSLGTYYFYNVPEGNFYIHIVDSMNCHFYLSGTTSGDLEIVDANINCTGNTITINISGGTAPYEYSIDGGETYTNPISGTTYTFEGVDTTLTHSVVVRDSDNNIFNWGNVSCDLITVTYETYYINPLAEGTILDEEEVNHEESFSVTLPWGSTYETFGELIGDTTFIGWSYLKPSARLLRLFTRNNRLEHIFTTDTTIYAIFDNTVKSNPYHITMCFYPTSDGNDDSYENKVYYCEECPETVTIYADRTEVYNLGIENVTWYKDPLLTELVDNGFYKPNNIRGLIPIYYSENGLPTIIDVCPIGEPEDLYC